jgi:hypothetical protein
MEWFEVSYVSDKMGFYLKSINKKIGVYSDFKLIWKLQCPLWWISELQ